MHKLLVFVLMAGCFSSGGDGATEDTAEPILETESELPIETQEDAPDELESNEKVGNGESMNQSSIEEGNETDWRARYYTKNFTSELNLYSNSLSGAVDLPSVIRLEFYEDEDDCWMDDWAWIRVWDATGLVYFHAWQVGSFNYTIESAPALFRIHSPCGYGINGTSSEVVSILPIERNYMRSKYASYTLNTSAPLGEILTIPLEDNLADFSVDVFQFSWHEEPLHDKIELSTGGVTDYRFEGISSKWLRHPVPSPEGIMLNLTGIFPQQSNDVRVDVRYEVWNENIYEFGDYPDVE